MNERVIYHKKLLKIISYFNNPKWGTLKGNKTPFNNVKAYLYRDRHWYKFKFELDLFEMRRKKVFGKQFKNVGFETRKYLLVLEDFFIGDHSPPQLTSTVGRIHTNGFSKTERFYYRLIIKLTRKLSFHYQIDQSSFTTDLGYRSREGLKTNINGEQLIVSLVHNDSNEYFISIESRIAQSFEQFSTKAHAIKNGIGYLTGHMPATKGYYFAYSKENMRTPDHFFFCGIRNEIVSSYSPVYSNPYGYIRNKKVADKYYKKELLRPITATEFSSLCQKIHDSIDFESALVLILESSAASLLFTPGSFAIVLETLSDLIIGNNKTKLSPIKSKPLSRKIREECTAIINKYSTDLKTLLGRIEQLNQTTNKVRLKAPFDLLGIDLLEEDLKILETRNDFLHGRIPDITNAGPRRSLDRKNNDLYYASMRFYTILNLLILKWIGYDNYIVNHAQLQSRFCNVPLKEDLYRKV